MSRRLKIEDIVLFHGNLFPGNGSFNIDCEDGWYEIIADFCELAEWTLRRGNRTVQTLSGDQIDHPAPTFQFTAIYEKVGWLNLEYKIVQPEAETNTKDIGDIEKRLFEVTCEVNAFRKYARHLSRKTCEACGSSGRFHVVNLFVPGGRLLNAPPQGWQKTLCSKCAQLLGYYEPEWRPAM